MGQRGEAGAGRPIKRLLLRDEGLVVLQLEGLPLNHLLRESARFETLQGHTVHHAHVDARLVEQV